MQYAVILVVNAESTPKSWKAAFSAAASTSACVDSPTLYVKYVTTCQFGRSSCYEGVPGLPYVLNVPLLQHRLACRSTLGSTSLK